MIPGLAIDMSLVAQGLRMLFVSLFKFLLSHTETTLADSALCLKKNFLVIL